MIDYLKHMALFARVVEEGSFRAAASASGLAPSRISDTISQLETHLGTTLLYRTTRKMSLTHEGRVLYGHVKSMLQNAETGLNEINALLEAPAGALQISAPAFLADSTFTTVIARYAAQNSSVKLSITYTDRQIDLIENGYDLAIRAGWLKDSSFMSLKLGEQDRLLVASPTFLETRAPIETPQDITECPWLSYEQRPDTFELRSQNNVSETIKGSSIISVDSVHALYHLTCQSLGVTILPRSIAQDALASGRLQHVLPDWHLAPLGFYAVWPDRSRRESLTVQFARFLANELKPTGL